MLMLEAGAASFCLSFLLDNGGRSRGRGRGRGCLVVWCVLHAERFEFVVVIRLCIPHSEFTCHQGAEAGSSVQQELSKEMA